MYEFFTELSRTINSNQSRSIILTGNTQDLFFSGVDYLPLVEFISTKYDLPNISRITYEINGEILFNTRFIELADQYKINLDKISASCKENQVVALEFIRTIALKLINERILVVLEGADLLIPDANIASLSPADRKKVTILQDIITNPQFVNSQHALIMISESKSQVHRNISNLPQILSINIPSPNLEQRKHFISYFEKRNNKEVPSTIVSMTAGLSIQAIHQLASDVVYSGESFDNKKIIDKVESFIQGQLGEDVVEFKKPTHTLDQVIGFSKIKKFIVDEMIPRFKANDDSALSGAAVAGPIGVGKTYIFEAMASALDIPVLVIKNIRSQWYGQTDIIFERLRRVLEALDKVVIFVDEADTQFGKLSSDAHETERRLTGKFQQMMSDTKLKGKVIWILMTARIWMLSADIRRPGRVGDLIIPILDPTEEQDIHDFVAWMLPKHVELTEFEMSNIKNIVREKKYSAAAFSSLRSRFKSDKISSFEEIKFILEDTLNPDIEDVRRYQTCQALINCTRKSLLPQIKSTLSQTISTSVKVDNCEMLRIEWFKEIQDLEVKLKGKI